MKCPHPLFPCTLFNNPRTRFRIPGMGLLVLLGALTGSMAQETGRLDAALADRDGLAALEKNAALLVSLRREIVEERERARSCRIDAELQRQRLENRKEVLSGRLESIQDLLETLEIRENGVRKRRAEAEKERTLWRSFAESTEDRLERIPVPAFAEEASRQWEKGNPDTSISTGAPASAGPAGTASRVERLCARLDRVHDFSERVSASRLVLANPEGLRQSGEALFVGLARGFALAPDKRSAWIGTPSATGWTWRVENRIAPRIAEALPVYRQQVVPRLVSMPFPSLQHKDPAP